MDERDAMYTQALPLELDGLLLFFAKRGLLGLVPDHSSDWFTITSLRWQYFYL